MAKILSVSVEFAGHRTEFKERLEARLAAAPKKGKGKALKIRMPPLDQLTKSVRITHNDGNGVKSISAELPDDLKQQLRAWVDQQIA